MHSCDINLNPQQTSDCLHGISQDFMPDSVELIATA